MSNLSEQVSMRPPVTNPTIPVGFCQCGCGRKTIVARQNSLKNGWVKGQPHAYVRGHSSRKNYLVGQRFGRLTVISEAKEKVGICVAWLCQCDCGNTCTPTTRNLKSGRTQSCGCLRLDMMSLPLGVAWKNKMFEHYQRMASRFGRAWELTRGEFDSLIVERCYYCNLPPLIGRKIKDFRSPSGFTVMFFNGIDRRDNRRGYTKANSVSCCVECNMMKRNFPSFDFVARCMTIAKHWTSRDADGKQLEHFPFSPTGRGDSRIDRNSALLERNESH